MIWIRRLFTIPLVLLFLGLFVLLLFVTQVNSTVGDPDFYNRHMEKADVYNYCYDELLPAALDEVESDNPANNPINVDDIEDEIISATRQVFPPEWLQEHFELATEAIIPYLLGSDDEFSYTLNLKPRIIEAADVIKSDFLQGETYDIIYDDLMAYTATKLVERSEDLPYALVLDEKEVEKSLRKVISKNWLSSQMRAAIDAVLPYFTLEKDHYTIVVTIDDRVDPMAEEAFRYLNQQATWDFLSEEVVAPIVREDIEPPVNLPYNVTLTDEELITGLGEVLPDDWLRLRLRELVDSTVDYIKWQDETIELRVSLSDRKPLILDTLLELADQKLEAMAQTLPRCSQTEFNIAKNNTPWDELPYCYPIGATYEQYKDMLHIDLTTEINTKILDLIPDYWIYDYADFRNSLGEEHQYFFENARIYYKDGWTFTDDDLRNNMNSVEDYETLEDVREWLSSNYTVTENDITEDWSDYDQDQFDMFRSIVGSARTWLWTLWVVPILILIDIGFISGRNWWSRLAWALGSLFVGSLIVFIGAILTHSYSNLDEVFDLAEYEGMDLVLAEKGSEILENVGNDFFSGIQNGAMWTMIFAGVVLLAIAAWRFKEWRWPSPVPEPVYEEPAAPEEEDKRPRRGRRTVSRALLEMMIDLSAPDEGDKTKRK